MKTMTGNLRLACMAALAGVMMLGAGCAMHHPHHGVTLSGAQEVPPNPSSAKGKSTIWVGSDKSVGGEVIFSGMVATAAHIHEAPAGVNGPVIVPLTKTSETSFAVPPNSTLTDAQYASYQAGNLYVNVHSAAYPGGEIRAQLKAK